jgi:hypothetical protein
MGNKLKFEETKFWKITKYLDRNHISYAIKEHMLIYTIGAGTFRLDLNNLENSLKVIEEQMPNLKMSMRILKGIIKIGKN